jgi:hypothetical protein
MADYFRFSCPKCGQRLKARIAAVGRRAHCKRCGAPFGVPEPADSKDDSPTPQIPEASLEAAETDPAPMVLKDETFLNYDAVRPGHRPEGFSPPRKGCGRALGLAGLTVAVGCTVIGTAAFGLGNNGSGTSIWLPEATASPPSRSSDVSQPRSKPAMPAAPRARNVGKSKPSPRAPTGDGRS